MKVHKLMKKDFKQFVEILQDIGTICAPVQTGKNEGNATYTFKENPNIEEIDLDYNRTIIPPKLFVNPPVQRMYEFKGGEFVDLSETCETEKRVLLGVHPCDLHGLRIVSSFYEQPFNDAYVESQRKNTVIIGVSCMPDEFCFCNGTNTAVARNTDYDLFMTDLKDYFLIWVGSSVGDDIRVAASKLLEHEVTPKDMQEFSKWNKTREESFTRKGPFAVLSDLMLLHYENPAVWEPFSERCFGCGSCTMVCPTCTCYDANDVIGLEQGSGHRERQWDSCMFPSFSLVAGEHDFRPTRADRLKLWYTHKLRAFVGNNNLPACVGCGRCIVTCPVDINVPSVAQALLAGNAPEMQLRHKGGRS